MAKQAGALSPEQRALRWKRAFLALLAVNLLCLGVVGGAILKGPPEGRVARDPGFGPFAGALDEADRKALRRAFLDRVNGGEALRAALKQDMEAVLAALRADPFQSAALDSALAQQSRRLSDQVALGQTLMRDRLVEMTVAERRAFADRLEQSLARRGRKGGHDDKR